MNIKDLQRDNIKSLSPYACARSEFKGEASVFLDANENPFNNAESSEALSYNRYPDPLQLKLKERIAQLKGVRPTQIMIGNGSDEPIDLAMRIFCEPGVDNIVSLDPTYGMYEVCADINNVEYRKVLLREDFTLDADKVLAATDKHTKLIFLCSPNNPTGNLLCADEMMHIISSFKGIIIIDEAYIDFSPKDSWLSKLDNYPNIIILQTLSKAWGMAAVRCGMAFASEEIIGFFNKVKYPYNMNILTQEFVYQQLQNSDRMKQDVAQLIQERQRLAEALAAMPFIKHIYPSDANFLLVKTTDATSIYQTLMQQGVIVRNRNSVALCLGCLRITIGTAEENNTLLNTLKTIQNA